MPRRARRRCRPRVRLGPPAGREPPPAIGGRTTFPLELSSAHPRHRCRARAGSRVHPALPRARRACLRHLSPARRRPSADGAGGRPPRSPDHRAARRDRCRSHPNRPRGGARGDREPRFAHQQRGDLRGRGSEDPSERLGSLRFEDALLALRTNAVAPLMVTRQFWDLLKAGRSPRLVSVSSENGSVSENAGDFPYYYAASKAAMNMLTRSLAAEARRPRIISDEGG